MASIIFKVLETQSHFNATVKLANELKSRGYHILYCGEEKFRFLVEKLGFEFYKHSLYPSSKDNHNTEINKRKSRYRVNKEYEIFFLNGKLFDELINKYKPVLFFLDVSLSYLFPILHEKNIKYVIFTTKVNLNKAYLIPPFTSSFIPKDNKWSFYLIELLWIKYFFLKRLSNWHKKIIYFGASNNELAKKYLKKSNLSFKDTVNTKRVGHFGIKGTPEILLTCEEFDFPRKLESNQIYLSPCITYNSKSFELEESYVNLIDYHKNNGTKKIIYCSLGSYDFKYRDIRLKFILRIINVFLKKKNYILVISTGKDIDPKIFSFQAHHIFLFQKLPQLSLLANCALMINQGGMQSIEECIYMGVPMIVYPLNPNLDQKGNAARVVYHEIGLMGNIKKDSIKKISNKVEYVLNTKSFKSNILSIRERYLKNKSFNRGLNFIESLIIKKVLTDD